MFRVRLLSNQTKRTAQQILSGELSPATSDYEVIQELINLAREQGIELEFFRTAPGVKSDDFNMNQMQVALDRGIEVRPISVEQMQDAIDSKVDIRTGEPQC